MMALAIDSRQQQSQFNNIMNYDALRFAAPPPVSSQPQPQFTNPWVTSSAHAAGLYGTTAMPATTAGGDPKHYATHAAPATHAYSNGQLPAPSLATGILPMDSGVLDQSSLPFAQQDGMAAHRSYAGASYGVSAAAPQYGYGYQADRRASHPSVATNFFLGDVMEEQKFRQGSLIDFPDRFNTASEAERQSFSDALDASRGMVAMSQSAMSQSDVTPRNIYGNQGTSRNSSDSYGFPSSHSAHSSISSASTYPNYYNSSVSEASVGDYSSASESVDMPSSRTLPRPDRLMGGNLPPVPQSMMGQFSSKVSSSSQKKHKCKICDKRFTRPSSLQTHMYSHTGEKPFACDVDGCGRHFSVVSNLRRHRKVHRGEGHDPNSPDDED